MREQRFLKDFVGCDEAYHAAECRISSESTQAHYHDFAEIFWIIEGEGSHTVEAISQKVSKGDLVFLRPQDYHFFEPSSRLRFFNLAFPLNVLEVLHERYFRNAENFYGLNSELPIHLKTPRIDSSWLHYQQALLQGKHRDLLRLDIFLLNLFQRIYSHDTLIETESEPEWMGTLMSMLNEQEFLALPISEIARELGITPEYFARSLKKYRKIKPSRLLINARMDYAAGELEYTDRPIINIGMDCGYNSLSHFYQVFHRHWNCTPKEFRKNRKYGRQSIAL